MFGFAWVRTHYALGVFKSFGLISKKKKGRNDQKSGKDRGSFVTVKGPLTVAKQCPGLGFAAVKLLFTAWKIIVFVLLRVSVTPRTRLLDK